MGKRTIRLWHRVTCPKCQGEGTIISVNCSKPTTIECDRCKGCGLVNESIRRDTSTSFLQR